MSSSAVGIAFAIISSILSSVGFIFEKEAVRHLSPELTASALGLLGGVFLIGYAYHRKSLPSRDLIRTHAKSVLILAIFRSTIGTLLICYSLALSPTIKVMFFTKLEPYLVMFWFWLAGKQKLNSNHLTLLTIHIAGAILLSTGGHFSFGSSQLGDLFVLLAMISISFGYTHASNLTNIFGAISANGISSLLSGLILLPLAVAFAPANAFSLSAPGWTDLFVVVITFNVIALSLWFAALKSIEGWIVSALRATGPVFAAPVAYFMLGETLSEVQIYGALIVLLTSALIVRSRKPV